MSAETVAATMESRFLDELVPLHAHVGWGQLGLAGSLGYEGKEVCVHGERYAHALSTHPPARLLYYLGGGVRTFRSRVALNDDAPAGSTQADFVVIADGRQAAIATEVEAGAPPRDLEADVTDAHLLELVVTTPTFEGCHAVWLDPEVEGELPAIEKPMLVDPLFRAEITVPPHLAPAERCVATVVSPGFEGLLDDMLGSLVANGGCQDALVLVFTLATTPACEQIIGKYRAVPVRCRPLGRTSIASKSVLYAVARVAEARRYVCFDADTLVLGDLSPLFAAIDAVPSGSILACREGNGHFYENVGHALRHAYFGKDGDLERILGGSGEEGSYPLVVNDGVFAGDQGALLALDAELRSMPGAVGWLDAPPRFGWRNQLLFNLALARRRCGVELAEAYNVQLHTSDVSVARTAAGVEATWRDRPVVVLHRNGGGRRKHPELDGLYGSVDDPLAGRGDGDGYAAFLAALRGWVGRHGVAALGWSFYGRWDARGARVRDPSMLPVLALLHYLVRANGCVRVVETGTARGVSAACLASAVAHRPGARVVTFDPHVHAEREELWAALPPPMSACIEPRRGDAVAGLRKALAKGEVFEAALLDSMHTEQQVGAELALALQVVCPGGLVLLHDSRWVPDIGRVLDRAQDEGYGVVRLLGADSGVTEDDGLGLAVIENCRREGS